MLKKNYKTILFLLNIIVFICCLTGCENKVEKTKAYSVKELHITAIDDLYQKDAITHTAFFLNDKIGLALSKETFEEYNNLNFGISGDSSLNDYTNFIKTINKIDGEVIENDGLTYVKYNKTVAENYNFYMMFTYKTDDSFWLVNFFCSDKDKDVYEAKFIEWAKSVYFD